MEGTPGDVRLRSAAQLMWSSGGSVFVLTGNVHAEELFEMAQSVQ